MIKLTNDQVDVLKILSTKKGPLSVSTLQKDHPGKIKKTNLDSLVSKGLLWTRGGITKRYAIKASGRTFVNAKTEIVSGAKARVKALAVKKAKKNSPKKGK